MSGRLTVGTKLGKYEVVRFIAEGGMGELYVARASGIEGFEKTVALKRILSRFAARPDHVRMFLDEAKLAASLHHPNIVQVFDIGDEAGLFFSMEYVHGSDLRAVLEKARESGRPIPLPVVFEIALGIAAGLHHAHQAGVVHRDVSPSNVLLAHDGVVKLTDFGIAKATTQKPIDTRPGMLKGKVSYMSPEQCRDEQLDRRSDIFSLGILMYELSTLETPFGGTSDFAIMEQIVHRDAPSPATKRVEMPAELAAVIARALARDREQRFATAQEVQRELLKIARASSIDNSPLVLESYLRELFGAQVDAWRKAFAESSIAIVPTAATVHERQALPPVRPSRPRWPFALAAFGVAAAIAGVAIARRTSDSAPAAATASEPTVPALAPAPAPITDRGPLEPAPVETPSPPISKTTPPPRRVSPPRPRPVRATQPKVRATPDVPAPAVTPPKPATVDAAPPVREVPWDPDSPEFPKQK
jgi:serine/threonine protein kinase